MSEVKKKYRKLTPELFKKICDKLIAERKSIRRATAEYNVNHTTFFSYMRNNPELFNHYVRAKLFTNVLHLDDIEEMLLEVDEDNYNACNSRFNMIKWMVDNRHLRLPELAKLSQLNTPSDDQVALAQLPDGELTLKLKTNIKFLLQSGSITIDDLVNDFNKTEIEV